MPQTQTYGPPQGNTPSGPTTTERGFGRGNDSPAGFVVPGQQMGGMSGFGGGAPNLNVQRQQSPFEKLMQGSISGQLRDPTGFNRTQQQMLRNRAAEPIAGQQQINMQRTQEDAVRRGASGAAGDADIRDQLNRVGAQGAKDQSDASLNIDQMLAQLRQSGLSSGHAAGNSLLGTQTTDVRSLREMLTALFALQQQNGPGGMGLNIALGGR